jgi:hypothetical protein
MTPFLTVVTWTCTGRSPCIKHKGVGSMKRLGGGHGAPASRGTSYHTELQRTINVFEQLFLKTSKFPNKKGTFDVNIVFTATLAWTKRALFITKKALLVLWKNGGCTCPPPPGSYVPDLSSYWRNPRGWPLNTGLTVFSLLVPSTSSCVNLDDNCLNKMYE